MSEAPSILALAGSISPRRLTAEIARLRRRGREPTVLELLPGLLTASLLRVCREAGVGVEQVEGLLGKEGVYRVDAEAKRLTDEAFARLGREEVSRVIWHIFYWYRMRRACLGAAVLDLALSPEVYCVSLLGGDDLLADVLAQVCRRRGVQFRAPGLHPVGFARRQRVSRSREDSRLILNERLARGLKMAAGIIASAGRRRRALPVDCLLLTTLPSERATWLPLARGMPEGLRLGLTTTRKIARRGLPPGVPVFHLAGWVRRRRLEERLDGYYELWRLGRELPRLLPRLSWRGLELGEYTRGWLLVAIRRLFWALSRPAAALEELLETVKPRLLVGLTERNELVNLAFALASARGIPTLAVESHDMIWDSPLFGRLTADRMAVSGEYAAEIYARGGAPREKLVVTGQPSLDKLVEYRRGAARLFEKAANSGGPRLLVAITQPPDVALTEETRRDMLAGAFLAATRIPRLRVVVKPHPRESLSDLKLSVDLAGGAPEAVLPKKAELYALLAAADVVLTAFSTVGVEALYLGRPVICYKSYDGPAVLPYVDSRAVLCAKSPEEVAARVGEVLDGAVLESLAEGRREYIARHECAADGGGTGRVLSLMLEMMKKPGGEG